MSRERAKALTLLATVVGLSLMSVWLEVQFNYWNREFYNTFESRDQAEFFRQLGMFSLLALIWIITRVYRLYFLQMLQIEWRTWLTEHFLADWMRDQAHYRMQLLDRGTDNPDQRIADDLRLFVDFTSDLVLGLLEAVVTLVSFVIILWALSGAIELFGVSIPGYLVWVALIYAIGGTFLTHFIGRRLIGLDFNQQRVEADFRFSLVRLRENSEGVALYRGEAEELGGLRGRFAAVIGNWWQIMFKRKQLGWFTSFYAQLAIIFPYVVVSPRFFSGAIPLGQVFQTASAFGQVQGSLSWFINAYVGFAQWKATVDRLIGFRAALERVREEGQQLDGERAETAGSNISIEGLEVNLPHGKPLLASTALELKPGENVLVTGPSGAGKSTFFRALSGIWPYWKGRIRLPHGARMLFLPQKAYLPIGSLKRAVCYPDDPAQHSEESIRTVLSEVGLVHLAGDLERTDNWSQRLSGGEQQRLAFARALLTRPDWLFLDEATASLPEADQERLYRLLKERLPKTTFVSVGHRESLAAWHDRRLVWRDAALAPA
ncbi:MAG TPA: ABC transporter ATP-binding protein/permease [Burkholderiales bacterium]|nr:ABC transporter ATP-binding protein/permease [Burkholderiales bacterium]